MKFLVTGDKMVMACGKIITIKSGEFETDCVNTCKALANVNGIKQVEQKKSKKKDK